LGVTWSSSWITVAPARSSCLTVRATLSALPKPVSASTMIGSETRSRMFSSVSATSLAVTRPMSGRPSRV